jgi:mono/diheme cytochrome c family protein
LLVIVVVVGIGVAVAMHQSAIPKQDKPPSFTAAQIEAGRRVANAANCVACHTTPDGQPFAGGLAIPTSFGTIYSSNITPDMQTGIGPWTLAGFTRAMREGVANGGTQLYPAFPFDHYTRMNDGDINDLYAFIMTRDPVSTHAPETNLRFPYSFRPLLAGWRLLFLKKEPVPRDPQKSAAWNRGAYLVEAMGHCGSCHTPRNSMGAEIASRRFDGGESGGWWAPPLNASSPALLPWTPENVFNYLRSWDEAHGSAHGPMAEVTASIRRLPEEDARAIATYVSDMLSGAPNRSGEAKAMEDRKIDVSADQHLVNGKTIFDQSCARCHESGGQVPYTTRSLAQHTIVQGPDPRNAVNIVLNGIPAEERPAPIMPAFALLGDDQIADLLAYVRKRYTNEGAWNDVQGVAAQARRQEQSQQMRTTAATAARQ